MKDDPRDILNSIMQGMAATGVADPAAQLPNVAMGLFHLGSEQSKPGGEDEVVAHVRELVAQQRELVKVDPHLGRRRLGSALNMFGGILRSLGRLEDALEVTLEAVEIRRELAQADPAEFLPNLASALSNLGCFLHELGREDEGLAALAESVAIQRTLATASPETAGPQLATMLYNFGVLLGTPGRWQDALPILREAVEMQRLLVKTSPELLPHFAMALNKLEECLTELGQHNEAAAVNREAAAVWTKIAEMMPELLSSDAADGIGDLAKRVTKSARGGRKGKKWRRWR